MTEQTYRQKLIEVDLPLKEINAAAAKEKGAVHGHPSTLHRWWARRPLATCRAVIFASMVDDPSSCPDEFPSEEAQHAERERLHDLIKRLVVWKTSSNEALINEARYEIARSVARARGQTAPTDPAGVLEYLRDEALPIYDPFAGGGSIPLEAQRLGLRAIASDLNPVAVLINKALVELPPKFANQPPVNPDADPLGITVGKGKKAKQVPWRGTAGLTEDIRYYGNWIREAAHRRIGHFFPKAQHPGSSDATVTAWLWARTIPCPNPACAIDMPMVKTYCISQRLQQYAYPQVDPSSGDVSFSVQSTSEESYGRGTASQRGVTCVACGQAVTLDYVREQSRQGKLREQMTAIVAEGEGERLFVSPSQSQVDTARKAVPSRRPEGQLPAYTTNALALQSYGIREWHQLFTERQLLALTTFSDLVSEVHAVIVRDGGSTDYASVVCTYLALAVGKDAHMGSSFAVWENAGHFVSGVFRHQGIPMIWDFVEKNPFSTTSGNWSSQINWIVKVLNRLPLDTNNADVHQADATKTPHAADGPVIVTDPPYYDNMLYADTSDFFYVWLRPLLRDVYPDLFAGMLTPKEDEMVAHPNLDSPQEHFESLLGKSLATIRSSCTDEFPSSIFYAYKQQEEERDGRVSTGWDTILTALIAAGFRITGTWPMRTEQVAALKANINSLASSVVLVCRPRPETASAASRREFLNVLEEDLPTALDHLTRESHIAPVDLAQAAIGPGMEIFSRYSRVETIGGEPVTVREALAAINRVIAEYDKQQQGELDEQTRFCLDWLEQHDYSEGDYGDAEQLARAKNVLSVDAMAGEGLLRSRSRRVKLTRMEDYDHSTEASSRFGMTAWEGCLRIAWHLGSGEGRRGVAGAAQVARAMSNAESVERLARILYNYYDRRGDSRNAVLFNTVVVEWPAIVQAMGDPEQGQMLGRT